MSAILFPICIVLGLIFIALGNYSKRDHIRFNIVGISNERRTVELLGALAAAHQAKADAALEKEFSDRVSRNLMRRERRREVRARMQLIHGDAPGYVVPHFLRRQAN